jgi:hypothetical protein
VDGLFERGGGEDLRDSDLHARGGSERRFGAVYAVAIPVHAVSEAIYAGLLSVFAVAIGFHAGSGAVFAGAFTVLLVMLWVSQVARSPLAVAIADYAEARRSSPE